MLCTHEHRDAAAGASAGAAIPHSSPVFERLPVSAAADDGYDYLAHMRVLGQGAASLEGMAPTPAAAGAAGAAAVQEQPSTASAASAASAAGPSTFVPAPGGFEAPEEDLRIIDASRLTVMQQVQEEQAATVMMGGVTAFSKDRPSLHGTGACVGGGGGI